MSACFADVRSATITCDVVHTLQLLLGISNPSSFHQCPTECVFSSANDHDSVIILGKDGRACSDHLWFILYVIMSTVKTWQQTRSDVSLVMRNLSSWIGESTENSFDKISCRISSKACAFLLVHTVLPSLIEKICICVFFLYNSIINLLLRCECIQIHMFYFCFSRTFLVSYKIRISLKLLNPYFNNLFSSSCYMFFFLALDSSVFCKL